MGEISVNIGKVIEKFLPEAINAALEDACQLIENDAVDNCPVDDGTLRGNITHKVSEEDGIFTGTVGTNVEYAPYVHEGTGQYAREGMGRKNVPWRYRDAEGNWHTTSGQKPNPFLQKAIDSNMNDILKCFEGCLKE